MIRPATLAVLENTAMEGVFTMINSCTHHQGGAPLAVLVHDGEWSTDRCNLSSPGEHCNVSSPGEPKCACMGHDMEWSNCLAAMGGGREACEPIDMFQVQGDLPSRMECGILQERAHTFCCTVHGREQVTGERVLGWVWRILSSHI